MADLIDRQAAIDELMCLVKQHECDLMPDLLHWTGVKAMLESLPSAQRTGRWIWDEEAWGDEAYRCSACGYHAYGNTSEIMLGDFKFCPNCGCAMEGEEE